MLPTANITTSDLLFEIYSHEPKSINFGELFISMSVVLSFGYLMANGFFIITAVYKRFNSSLPFFGAVIILVGLIYLFKPTLYVNNSVNNFNKNKFTNTNY